MEGMKSLEQIQSLGLRFKQESVETTDIELPIRMSGTDHLLGRVEIGPHLTIEVVLELTVDSIYFLEHGLFWQQRRDELVGQDVETLEQTRLDQIHVVDSLVLGSISIGISHVLGDAITEQSSVGILLTAPYEQHVFHEVRQSGELLRVFHAACSPSHRNLSTRHR